MCTITNNQFVNEYVEFRFRWYFYEGTHFTEGTFMQSFMCMQFVSLCNKTTICKGKM